MADITLRTSTNISKVDQVVREIIGLVERHFCDRLRVNATDSSMNLAHPTCNSSA